MDCFEQGAQNAIAIAKEIFDTLFAVNVSEYTEERKNLTYLSWSHALTETMKLYPDMTYTIRRFGPDDLPYQFDPVLGYMVATTVTIRGITKEMWLPVLDTNNKAMKAEPYTYDTKNQKGIKVEAASSYDINKALMRCLVKNLAAFGLALYIYNKDDLPEAAYEEDEKAAAELAEAIKKVSAKGSELIAAGFSKDAVRETVANLNNGNASASSIESVEIAAQILAAFEEMHPEKKRVPTKKTTTKKEND